MEPRCVCVVSPAPAHVVIKKALLKAVSETSACGDCGGNAVIVVAMQ